MRIKAPCPRALLPGRGSNRGPPVWKSEVLSVRPRQLLDSYNVNEFVWRDLCNYLIWDRSTLYLVSFYLFTYQLIKYSFIFKIFPSWDVFSLCSWRCQQSKMADFIWEVCSTSEEELLMQMLYPPHVRLDFGIAKENLTWFETEGVKKACL